MDIPESGAVFTLGKSYLSENHQSYFFIRNDPIKKLIAGSSQSAVICESGRLFVWGENQFGQLGTGSSEIVTKPSCVKAIKSLGHKVRNIAFGEQFSIVLTESNKLFFSGKSIFTLNERYGNKLCYLGKDEYVARQPFEIEDFEAYCTDVDGNRDEFVDIAAGGSHFVVLTNSGVLFRYGLYDSKEIKKYRETLTPTQISDNLVVRVARCGSTFTVFVTYNNEVYLCGYFNGAELASNTKLNTKTLRDSIYTLYVSNENEIFLVLSSGDVYKSSNDQTDIHFERIILFNDSDNIQKFSSGEGFVCVLTDNNKLLTTFVEKTSAKRGTTVTPPRELRKFQDLHILDATCGRHHILIFAALKTTIFTSLDISSSDPNDNGGSFDEPPAIQIIKNNNHLQTVAPIEPPAATPIPQRHVLTKQNVITKIPVLEKKLAEIQNSDETNPSQTSTDTVKYMPSAIISENGVKSPKAAVTSQDDVIDKRQIAVEKKPPIGTKDIDLESSASLNEFESLEMESALNAVSGVGKMVEHEVKTEVSKVVTDGMKQMDGIKDKTIETIKEAPNEAMKVINTEIVQPVGAKLHQLNEKKNEMINDAVDGVKTKTDSVIHTLESKFHLDDKKEKENGGDQMLFKKNETLKNNIEKDGNTNVTDNADAIAMEMHRDKIMKELAKDEKIEVLVKEENGKMTSSIKDPEDVTFINDGIDVTNDVSKLMKEEMDEMEKGDHVINAMHTKNEDNLLGEKLIGVKPVPSNLLDSKEKLLKKASIEGKYIPLKGPLHPEMEEIDLDGDGEHTTASIKSITPAKNPFDDDADDSSLTKQVDKMGSKVTSAVRDGEGRVKRFFKEIKNKSNCKNADTALESTDNIDVVDKKDLDEYTIDNKTSKVCTIL